MYTLLKLAFGGVFAALTTASLFPYHLLHIFFVGIFPFSPRTLFTFLSFLCLFPELWSFILICYNSCCFVGFELTTHFVFFVAFWSHTLSKPKREHFLLLTVIVLLYLYRRQSEDNFRSSRSWLDFQMYFQLILSMYK